MRRATYPVIAATAIAAALLVVSAPVAPAQLVPAPGPTITVVPEQPLGRVTAFVDNPAIIDTRPQLIQAWSRLPDDRSVAVEFTTGTPECYGVHAEVQETADIVAVKLRSGTLPEAAQRACIAIGVVGSLDVPLQSPLGQRAVVSIT
ncbi:hypothetical protein ACN27E_05195 [Mycobacterium sp. WMMD1722]|uniref:hypothetical protein n=1 Tax=Mycobacterium sp. WMMD1722 TaxID=3404117 RepID=UPI003BF4D2D3